MAKNQPQVAPPTSSADTSDPEVAEPTAADVLAHMRRGSPQREAVQERITTMLRKGLSDVEIADELTDAVADGLGITAGAAVHGVICQLAAAQRKGR